MGEDERKRLSTGLLIVMALQALCVVISVVVPFGFDKPSSWGLDFEDLLLLGAFYGILLLIGFVLAASQRRWDALVPQLAGPLVAYLLMIATGR